MIKQKQRINVIRGEDLEGMYVGSIQGYSNSKTISNLIDLISNIDMLMDVGYEEYVKHIKDNLECSEKKLSDVTHLKHLYKLDEEKLKKLEILERESYIDRNLYKIELLFLETNSKIISALLFALSKIVQFNETKNSREYKLKKLNLEEI